MYGISDSLTQFFFFDLLLPFILIFTLVFAILQKVKIFGDPKKTPEVRKYNIAIAFVVGLSVVLPHIYGWYPPGQNPVAIMQGAIPNVGLLLVAILMALLIIGLLGKRFEIGGGTLSGWIALAAFVAVFAIFGSAANWWSLPVIQGIMLNPDMLALIVTILVFAIIVWFVTSEPKTESDKNSIGNQIDNMLKGN